MLKERKFFDKDWSIIEYLFNECKIVPENHRDSKHIVSYDQIRKHDLILISSDNIRVGISITINDSKIYFLNPKAFALGYLTREDLVSLEIGEIGETYEEQRNFYLNKSL